MNPPFARSAPDPFGGSMIPFHPWYQVAQGNSVLLDFILSMDLAAQLACSLSIRQSIA